MMMQQMMLAASGGASATPTSAAGLFQASTPLARGSTPRHPFFSPHSATESNHGNVSRPPPLPMTPMMGMQGLTTPSSSSFPGLMPASASTPRQPQPPSTSATAANNSNNTTSSEAIIAGVSFLVRSEGQATVQQVQTELQKHETAVEHRLRAMEQTLQQQQATLQAMMQQQQGMIQRQFETMTFLQQQHMQWMSAMPNSSQQQHVSETPHPEVEQQVPFSPLAQAISESESSFPAESSYDPTCRIKMTDVPSPSAETATDESGNGRNDDDDAGNEHGDDEAKDNDANTDDTQDPSNEEDPDDSKDTGGTPEGDGNGGDEPGAGKDQRQEGNDSAGDNNNNSNDSQRQCDKKEPEDCTALVTMSETCSGSSVTDSSKSGIVQKQFMFEASTKGLFPTGNDSDQEELSSCMSTLAAYGEALHQHAVVWEKNQLHVGRSNNILSIEKNASMVDHLSIRCSNTGGTPLPALASMPTNSIDQVESIEVLAVFQKSPTGDDANSPGFSPHSTTSSHDSDLSYGHVHGKLSAMAGGIIKPTHTEGTESIQSEAGQGNAIDDQNPSYESSDSYDGSYEEDQDMVSVSLQVNEKVPVLCLG